MASPYVKNFRHRCNESGLSGGQGYANRVTKSRILDEITAGDT